MRSNIALCFMHLRRIIIENKYVMSSTIMQTKLTLRLEDSLIQQAKDYAKQHDKSLSQVVSDYFQALTQKSNKPLTAPVTQSLIGVLDASNVDATDYKKHLEEKYL